MRIRAPGLGSRAAGVVGVAQLNAHAIASRSTASTKLRLSILRMKSITSPPSAQAPKQYQ